MDQKQWPIVNFAVRAGIEVHRDAAAQRAKVLSTTG
jgi:hypothetical protein